MSLITATLNSLNKPGIQFPLSKVGVFVTNASRTTGSRKINFVSAATVTADQLVLTTNYQCTANGWQRVSDSLSGTVSLKAMTYTIARDGFGVSRTYALTGDFRLTAKIVRDFTTTFGLASGDFWLTKSYRSVDESSRKVLTNYDTATLTLGGPTDRWFKERYTKNMAGPGPGTGTLMDYGSNVVILNPYNLYREGWRYIEQTEDRYSADSAYLEAGRVLTKHDTLVTHIVNRGDLRNQVQVYTLAAFNAGYPTSQSILIDWIHNFNLITRADEGSYSYRKDRKFFPRSNQISSVRIDGEGPYFPTPQVLQLQYNVQGQYTRVWFDDGLGNVALPLSSSNSQRVRSILKAADDTERSVGFTGNY